MGGRSSKHGGVGALNMGGGVGALNMGVGPLNMGG